MLPTKCVSYLHLTFPIEQWDIRHDKQMRGFQSVLTPGEIFEGCRMHNCNAATHTQKIWSDAGDLGWSKQSRGHRDVSRTFVNFELQLIILFTSIWSRRRGSYFMKRAPRCV